jgi:hypothetical protein
VCVLERGESSKSKLSAIGSVSRCFEPLDDDDDDDDDGMEADTHVTVNMFVDIKLVWKRRRLFLIVDVRNSER